MYMIRASFVDHHGRYTFWQSRRSYHPYNSKCPPTSHWHHLLRSFLHPHTATQSPRTLTRYTKHPFGSHVQVVPTPKLRCCCCCCCCCLCSRSNVIPRVVRIDQSINRLDLNWFKYFKKRSRQSKIWVDTNLDWFKNRKNEYNIL